MSSAGSPIDVSTMIMVTNPALGMAAAPTLAQVAVRLQSNVSAFINRAPTTRKSLKVVVVEVEVEIMLLLVPVLPLLLLVEVVD